MGQEIGADDTLIFSVVIEDYVFDHMFTECGFHCKDYWAMGVDKGAIGHFDFTTDQRLMKKHRRRLFVAAPSIVSGCIFSTMVLIRLSSSRVSVDGALGLICTGGRPKT
uniref:Uncharacterized protein n=1 Tax=Romanomermis culicivorax TaxID=13658 RepID=A0A915ID03_ROMCU